MYKPYLQYFVKAWLGTCGLYKCPFYKETGHALFWCIPHSGPWIKYCLFVSGRVFEELTHEWLRSRGFIGELQNLFLKFGLKIV